METDETRPGMEDRLRCLEAVLSPDGASGVVRRIETHMSWILIGERQVLKLKKPVRYPFLDLSTVQARERNGREELRLNRRLAPQVYLACSRSSWTMDRFAPFPKTGCRHTPASWTGRSSCNGCRHNACSTR